MDINAKKVRQPRHSVVGGLGLAGFAGMGPPDHSTCPVTLPHALPRVRLSCPGLRLWRVIGATRRPSQDVSVWLSRNVNIINRWASPSKDLPFSAAKKINLKIPQKRTTADTPNALSQPTAQHKTSPAPAPTPAREPSPCRRESQRGANTLLRHFEPDVPRIATNDPTIFNFLGDSIALASISLLSRPE